MLSVFHYLGLAYKSGMSSDLSFSWFCSICMMGLWMWWQGRFCIQNLWLVTRQIISTYRMERLKVYGVSSLQKLKLKEIKTLYKILMAIIIYGNNEVQWNIVGKICMNRTPLLNHDHTNNYSECIKF